MPPPSTRDSSTVDDAADPRIAGPLWYQNVLTPAQIHEVESYTLADLILNNTGLSPNEINLNAFQVKH